MKKLDNLKGELSELNGFIENKSKEQEALKVHYDKYIEAGAALKNLGDKEKIQVSINQLSEKIAFEEKKINECIAKENSISLDIDIDDLNNKIDDKENFVLFFII